MDHDQTPQAALWRGEFGDDYTDRNPLTSERLVQLTRRWSRVLELMDGDPPRSILEVGANVGANMHALSRVTGAELYAVEPNAKARAALTASRILPADHVVEGLATRIPMGDGAVDMAFTSGVLIHIHPRDLLVACAEIHRVARRYVFCSEYFSDQEEEVAYRGHREALFKRDFGGFWLDNFSDLRLVDYGFTWRRVTGLDNANWWLFAKA